MMTAYICYFRAFGDENAFLPRSVLTACHNVSLEQLCGAHMSCLASHEIAGSCLVLVSYLRQLAFAIVLLGLWWELW